MTLLLLAALALEPHAIILGIDGTTTHALTHAVTPNLHSIGPLTTGVRIHNGWHGADTSTGPGWASVLCGVWPEVHGVTGNDVRPMPCATFLDRIAWERPWARPKVLAVFPAVRHVAGLRVTAAYPVPPVQRPYRDGVDDMVVGSALRALTGPAPCLFVHLAAVDEAGHNDGFDSPAYLQALEDADVRVGQLLAAIAARPWRDDERWLVIATTDHGGRGLGHNAGWDDAAVSSAWAVSSGEPVHALTDVAGVVVRWMR